MNRIILFFRKHAYLITGMLAAAVILSACKKDNDDTPPPPAAGLMTFNLAPDQNSVTVTISGNSLTPAPLAFTSYTGHYQNIFTGQRPVESFDFPNSTPLATVNYNFEQNKSYSLFVVGAHGNYSNLVSVDSVGDAEVENGKAYVRYINAIPDSSAIPNVTISSGGTPVVNQASPYATISTFKSVTPGTVAVAISNGGNINAGRDITLEGGKAYTVLLVGLPDVTEESGKVQIRFIENGTVTAEKKENGN